LLIKVCGAGELGLEGASKPWFWLGFVDKNSGGLRGSRIVEIWLLKHGGEWWLAGVIFLTTCRCKRVFLPILLTKY
jgi:hypothetical protein